MKVGITGHQTIPEEALPFITHEIGELLDSCARDLTGVSSLASGADQLFASAVVARGGALCVVIPSADYETTFSDARDRATYASLLTSATSVETLPFAEPSEEAFLAAGRRVVEIADLLIAVWDGQPPRGLGGTADIVRYARERGVPVHIVWPPGVRR